MFYTTWKRSVHTAYSKLSKQHLNIAFIENVE